MRFVLILAALLLNGCTTKLTQSGAGVRTFNIGHHFSGENCEFRGLINANSPPFALNKASEIKHMINDALNKTGELGGTHMKIINQDWTPFSGAFMTAEAYKCPENY